MATSTPPNGNGVTKWWQGWIPVAAGSIMVFGTIVTWVANINSQAQSIQALQSTQQENLRRLGKLESEMHTADIESARISERLTEIGTQIHALDEIADLERVDEIRFRGLVWEKVYGTQYPNPFYAPHIEREK